MEAFCHMPGHLIRRTQQIALALFAEECAGYDLTALQYAALAAIGTNPGVDATRLSALIAFDRSTIGEVLERLETKGWICRESSVQDRRLKLLSLTAAGLALLQQASPAVQRVQERIMAPLAPPERRQLQGLLTKLTRLHGATSAPPQPAIPR